MKSKNKTIKNQTQSMMENLKQETQNNFLMVPPEMTKEEYASLVKLDVNIIRNQLQRGLLPSVKRGRYRLVNTAKLFWDNANTTVNR